MKKIFLIQALIAIFLLSGCGQDSKKHMRDADENLKGASENLKEAGKDANAEVKAKATADWRAFKNESDRSIAAMENQANEFKAEIAKADKANQAKLTSDLNKLEQKLNEQKAKLNQKNAEFETDLENLNDDVIAKNEQFKKEFKHDMNGLGTAFTDLFKENIK